MNSTEQPERETHLRHVWNTLMFFAHPDSYVLGERVGGVLQGCPRNPPPTPDEMASYARQALASVCRYLGKEPEDWMTAGRASINSVVCEAGEPLNEDRILAVMLSKPGFQGRVALTYESGPYDLARPTLVAEQLVRAIEAAHGIGSARDSAEADKDSEALVLAIREHLDGWSSATFGWQYDPDPAQNERNKQAAIERHAAECIRRIRATLAEADKTKAGGVAQERCERARDGKHEFAYQPALGETICTYCGAGNRKAGA